MGLSCASHSTLIYTSELNLCSTICVLCATRHNIHMYPFLIDPLLGDLGAAGRGLIIYFQTSDIFEQKFTSKTDKLQGAFSYRTSSYRNVRYFSGQSAKRSSRATVPLSYTKWFFSSMVGCYLAREGKDSTKPKKSQAVKRHGRRQQYSSFNFPGGLIKLKTTIKGSDTFEHQPTVWPVPYACAQPYHPGSGSHGQLFRSR